MTKDANSHTSAALITGGAQRIGAAIAEDLAKAGMAVAIHYHSSKAEADALAGKIIQCGGRAAIIGGDLNDADNCNSVLLRAQEALGTIDLLVNNASIFKPDHADDADFVYWESHFALHLKAPVLLTAAMARQEKLHRGVVINMIDQRVWSLDPGFFSYTLSKSALWTATRTMAQHYAPRIRVNAIGPGPTLPNEFQNENDFQRQQQSLPLRHGPALEDFGRTIRYIYETESLTGQMIALDGGQHLAWD
jgi:NAD(P)-dependent dehydrogenase (short-subunit alcohol dehydrogenase family)